jgi:predicted SpoU family rRNA methylase
VAVSAAASADARVVGRRGDGVDRDDAREPVARAAVRVVICMIVSFESCGVTPGSQPHRDVDELAVAIDQLREGKSR